MTFQFASCKCSEPAVKQTCNSCWVESRVRGLAKSGPEQLSSQPQPAGFFPKDLKTATAIWRNL
jgi:hypothetical protein